MLSVKTRQVMSEVDPEAPTHFPLTTAAGIIRNEDYSPKTSDEKASNHMYGLSRPYRSSCFVSKLD